MAARKILALGLVGFVVLAAACAIAMPVPNLLHSVLVENKTLHPVNVTVTYTLDFAKARADVWFQIPAAKSHLFPEKLMDMDNGSWVAVMTIVKVGVSGITGTKTLVPKVQGIVLQLNMTVYDTVQLAQK